MPGRVAGVLHLAGELGYVAAGWTLSLGYVREQDRGAHQGATEAATATVQMVGPGLFTLALSGWGATGWVAVAAIFLLAGCAVPGTARWAARSRPAQARRCCTQSWNAPMWCSEGTSTPPAR